MFIADVRCVRESEKALLCEIYGEEIWVPKSQILEESDVASEGDVGFLHITEWFADKEGLN